MDLWQTALSHRGLYIVTGEELLEMDSKVSPVDSPPPGPHFQMSSGVGMGKRKQTSQAKEVPPLSNRPNQTGQLLYPARYRELPRTVLGYQSGALQLLDRSVGYSQGKGKGCLEKGLYSGKFTSARYGPHSTNSAFRLWTA